MLEPRRWQREAAESWFKNRRGVISVVTGAGKTAFALMVLERLRLETSNVRVVVLVPSIALMDQWYVALATDGGVDESQIATYSGEGKSAHPRQANIAVINTARDMASGIAAGATTFLIVDECHRAGAPENARALRTQAAFTLGLSATPVREFDDGFERYVEPALGPVVYEYGYAEARRDKIISDFTLHNYRFPLTQAERVNYEKTTRAIQRMTTGRIKILNDPRLDELTARRLRQTVESKVRGVAAVAVSREFGGRQLLFHERIDPAENIARLLDSAGVRVGLYHSRLSPSFRRRNLELFKERQFDTLVTCRALDEGINVPDASVALIAASTSSTRQRIQRLGRVLRPAPGKTMADVVTLYATPAEEETLREEALSLSEVARTNWYEIRI